ncbi:MAG: putative DNA binding domain-containing protein [Nitrospinae bacterium]|nr:putative DNA binding domain-containing protein [Nitrospinota bacterium]
MNATEGEHFEFKEANNRFSFEDLAQYCCAFANEGGGKVILGVTDKRPRQVVGTQAFPQMEDIRRSLMEKIPLNIKVQEIHDSGKRVLVFDIPSHPVGVPIEYKGRYWSRKADSLVQMTTDKLGAILAEAGHDFSADICNGATMQDIDLNAVEEFRRRWIEKSRNSGLALHTSEQLLRDVEVLRDEGLTYAALILFGTRQALGKHLAQAEVVFEYRSSGASGPAQQREDFREGFFLFYDELWKTINLRNDLQHYQDGLFILDIPTFEERSIREAVLNAISHRNYQLAGSVFIRQYSRRLVVQSPGGFPVGITVENVLDQQSPRNRRIAEVFARCGLVERSGQGMNLMFEESIQQGKPRPDFTGTDNYWVVLTLSGQVQDIRFLRFLEKVGQETTASFGTHDFLTLDMIHREEPVPEYLKPSARKLLELGIIESIGRGKHTRYILSHRLYSALRKPGVYTRKRGLDRETNKKLLLKHIMERAEHGATLAEFKQVLPSSGHRAIQTMLCQLRDEGQACLKGRGISARWYPESSLKGEQGE